jgi:hypothetical protein
MKFSLVLVHLLGFLSFHGSVLERGFDLISAFKHNEVLESSFNCLESVSFPVLKNSFYGGVLVLLELHCIYPLGKRTFNFCVVPS